MDPLISIGIIMTITGIVVWMIGRRRSVPNTVVWALFPIFHGMHEFFDYAVEELNAPFVYERFELFFAYASSLILLAAVIEFNGAVASPAGKIVGIITTIFLAFFLVVLTDDNLEDIAGVILNFGLLHSEPNRFFYGFFLVILSALIILISDIYLINQSKKLKISLDPRLRVAGRAAIIFLVFYAIFEGFDSTNAIFIQMRAVTLSIFIIIPLLFVLTHKPGLQRLLIIADTGELAYGYNFGQDKDIFSTSTEEELNNAVLTAGFLAAISGFSQQISQNSTAFSIRHSGLYFTLQKTGSALVALQSINYSKQLQQIFNDFTNRADIANILPQGGQPRSNTELDQFRNGIKEIFKRFY